MDGRLGLSYEWDEGYAVHGEVSALREDADKIRAVLAVRIDFQGRVGHIPGNCTF